MSQYGSDQFGIQAHGREYHPFDPTIPLTVTAAPIDKVTLRVKFSHPMRWTNPISYDDISNINNYAVTRGGTPLIVRDLKLRAANEVDLIIHETALGALHTLTVSQLVTTLEGRPFYEELPANPTANQATFLGIDDLPTVDLYINDAYGKGRFTYHGYGRELYPYDPINPMRIISAEALDVKTVRIVYSRPMRRTDTEGYDDATNPLNYHIQSGLSILTVSGVDILSDVMFDLGVSGMINGAEYLITVNQRVETEAGRPFLEEIPYNPRANKVNFVGLALIPVISRITNPADGFLKIVFNKAMTLNDAIERASNYIMNPTVRGAGEVTALRIVIVEETPNELLLQFDGSGGTYNLIVEGGVIDLAGNGLHPGPYEFTITNPSSDELFKQNWYFIDTTFGAIHFTINPLSARRVDDLTMIRTMDVGHEKQFQNISAALRRSGINRDDTRLKIFKG